LNSLDDFSGFCVLVFLDTLVFGGFQCHKQFLQKSSGEKVDLLVDLAFKTVHGQNVVAGHLWTSVDALRCGGELFESLPPHKSVAPYTSGKQPRTNRERGLSRRH